jgi:hypothetical protein
MFSFFRKKEVDNEQIKAFDGAIKAINIFILLSEWDKAKKALNEIEYKEKDSLNILLGKIDERDDKDLNNDKEKIKLTENFKKKQKKLDKLTEIVKEKEEKYFK